MLSKPTVRSCVCVAILCILRFDRFSEPTSAAAAKAGFHSDLAFLAVYNIRRIQRSQKHRSNMACHLVHHSEPSYDGREHTLLGLVLVMKVSGVRLHFERR